MINWYESPNFYKDVILTVSGIASLVAGTLEKTPVLTIPGTLMLIVGVLGVILQVWFPDKTVKTLFKR